MTPYVRGAFAAMTILAPGLLAGGSAAAQGAAPTVIPVQLSSYRFTPAEIELTHGQPYVLRLHNVSGKGHDLRAKAFFQNVRLASGSESKVENGRVPVEEDQSVDIALTPLTPGAYEMHCSRPFHSMQGMKGEIVVR
jgi:plastocyanin